ncbi:MAG: DUF4038 domain-containing protein [Acidobacteriota bacterium]
MTVKVLLFVRLMLLALCVVGWVRPLSGQPSSRFPLKVGPDGRHLVDRGGRPFLVHGDTPWSLTHNLTFEEAVSYMEDRVEKGFTALIVSAPDAYAPDGSHPDPPDRYGNFPFIAGDITQPDEAYWQNVDRVLKKAEDLGLLVFFFPAYLGCCDDGYLRLFTENGVEKSRRYGRWIGDRYHGRLNLVWVLGGDRNVEDVRPIVSAIHEGIDETDPGKLHAVHWAPETDPWAPFGEEWVDLYTAYTYGPVAARVAAEYLHLPTKPVILIETNYENDFNRKTAGDVRKYPYRAILSGAAGDFFGNKPLWFCGTGWERALDSPGSRYVALAGHFFRSLPWDRLAPDFERRFVVGGGGDFRSDDGVQAAISREGGLAVAFLPSARRITVDLAILGGSRLSGWWFSPMTGRILEAGVESGRGRIELAPPAAGDWVLVIADPTADFLDGWRAE